VVILNLSHNNYTSLLKKISAQLKIKIENNAVELPEELGNGVIKIVQLPNGLQALMANISFKKDVLVKSGNTNDGDYILNFDETENYPPKEEGSKMLITSFVRLTGESFKHWEVFKKGSSLQYVKILFSKAWLSNYIGLSKKMSLFEKYIPVKSEAGEKEKLHDDYKKIINEMWSAGENSFMQNMFYHNRILLLIEQFFTRAHATLQNTGEKFKLTADEILSLKKVERKLNTFSQIPPTVAYLATLAGLSETRLSQTFKHVYGTSIYNYYQQQRLKKGYELLEKKDQSIKAVSEKLGYSNVSNFVLAFTRQFNISPKGLLE
jgi:AraC-like DNA-binding protein